jgi:hypothetical protein
MNIYQKIEALRKELPAMRKSREGYNYKYFDINQMIEVLRPLLEKHKLTILQPLTNIEGRPALTTIIADDEENELKTTVTLPDLPDPQKMGSAVTYMRRYALQSLLFMEAEDDDGVKAKPDPSEVEDLQNSNYKPKF